MAGTGLGGRNEPILISAATLEKRDASIMKQQQQDDGVWGSLSSRVGLTLK